MRRVQLAAAHRGVVGEIEEIVGGAAARSLGVISGAAVHLIFWLRMRIEQQLGKAGVRQPSLGGFEAEDVLYLLPLLTLFGGLQTFILLAAIGAPAFLVWVIFESVRLLPGKFDSPRA